MERLWNRACRNGCQRDRSVELVKSVMPLILLTDIKMPGMDGLKLIEEAKNIVPEIKVSSLGYQDFSYAQTAIQFVHWTTSEAV